MNRTLRNLELAALRARSKELEKQVCEKFGIDQATLDQKIEERVRIEALSKELREELHEPHPD